MMAAMKPESILAEVIAAVEEEARRLLQEFLLPQGPRGRHAKAPIDTEIEIRLAAALQRLLPCPFLGEETGMTPGPQDGWLWLVDPHDGTKEFLAGRGGSAVSVGLLRDNVPVLGVITSPTSPDRGWDTIAWAEEGPLLRNGEPVSADLGSRPLSNRDIVWVTASAEMRPDTYSHAAAPARYIAMASIAYRLARIAAGDGAAAMSIHAVNEYDIAAGAALLRGAGGVLLDAQGREIVFTGAQNARVSGCFAGSREAARQLARFDWSSTQRETKKPRRIETAFPRVPDPRRSRAQGCLAGLVIGTSLGALTESRTAADIARTWPEGVRELADGGAWGTMAGQPTGAGELTIALARSLVREGGFEPNAVLVAYRRWLASEPFDVGATTRLGLLGEPDAASQSNGSLARVAALGVWAAGDSVRAASAARDDSRLTHPNPVCVEACAALAAAVAAGVAGASREAMLEAALGVLEQDADAVRAAIERAISGPGADCQSSPRWVLAALENAFFQLLHASSMEQALMASAAGGGDADANAAVVGALLGSIEGRQGLPSRWMLRVLACRPGAAADAFRPRPMEYWPDDVPELAEALVKLG